MKLSLWQLLKIWFLWNYNNNSNRARPKFLALLEFFGIHYWDNYGTFVRRCEACGKYQRMVTADGKSKGDVVRWEDFKWR